MESSKNVILMDRRLSMPDF